MFALGMTLAVFVAGAAAAKPSKKTTSAAATTSDVPPYTATTPSSPGDSFFVVNGTVNAASDHEILGTSAFPNFTTGAVDNYYSMAHSHVDNSPFAEGTASPADTGPIGQTAAAGQFQQPQYADARWPGSGSGTAAYGTKGQPYAEAAAGEYTATAAASEATNGLSGPGLDGKKAPALPAGFDLRLRQALAGWKSKWRDALGLQKPTLPKKPARPTVTTPIGPVTVPKAGAVTVPSPNVAPPAATVTTPVATVTTAAPQPTGGVEPAPPVTVPGTTLPSPTAQGASRSLAARRTPLPSAAPAASSTPPSPDGESLLTSSTHASLVPDPTPKPDACASTTNTKAAKTTTTKAAPCKTYALVTSGESSLGRVSLGGGQIVIEGIHVTASITNDGTPSYKAAVTVASATIGGVPVTIDQDGVHVSGQGQGLPYQQASDSLNGALKQAGIQLFLVGPEVTNNSCDQSAAGSGGSTSTSPSSTTTTGSSDQFGAPGPCGGQGGGTCDQSGTGAGAGGVPGLPAPAPTTSTDQSNTSTAPSSCDQSCDQSGASTGTDTTTTTTTTAPTATKTTATTTDQASGSGTTSSCGGTGLPSTTTGSCASPRTGTGPTSTVGNPAGATTTTDSSDQPTTSFGLDDSSSGEMTVTATGVHVVFTQPVSQPGVPDQYVEHILGEVFVDSLASPAQVGAAADLGFSSTSSAYSSNSGSPFAAPSSASCGGGARSGSASGGSASSAGGGSLAGGSIGGGALSSSGASQPGAGATGASLPAMFAAALRKPLWLLLAYVLWQSIVIGTGASLWNWRRGGAS